MKKNLEKWEKHYIRDCDALFVGVHPMVGDTMMFYMDEVMAYIDKNGEIKGIYIEYYKSDFVKKYKRNFKLYRGK